MKHASKKASGIRSGKKRALRPLKRPQLRDMLLSFSLAAFLVAGMLSLPGALEVFGASSPLKSGSYTHASRFKGDLVLHGIDVSYWQGTASNWEVAKRQGVEYAIMRVTWTSYSKNSHNYKNTDSHFKSHYKKAKDAGIMTGVYVFSQATSVKEAKNEANFAVETLKNYEITPGDLQLPVYMDYEYAGGKSGRLNGLKAATAKKCAKAFCDIIRDAGYQPGIYANTNFFKNMLGNGESLASDIDLWCAQYYKENQSGSAYSKWQYSSTANIGSGKKGILFTTSGKVGSTDVNFWYVGRKPSSSGDKDIAGMKIYGATEYNYTGKQIKPSFEVLDGSTRLKEGSDYTVGFINNVQKGSLQAYAYIKGVGDYSGYALIPFTIGSGYIKHTGLISDGKEGYILTNAGEKDTFKASAAIGESEEENDELVIVDASAETAENAGNDGADASSVSAEVSEEPAGAQAAEDADAEAESGAETDADADAVGDAATGADTVTDSDIATAIETITDAGDTDGTDSIILEGSVSEDAMQAAASSSSDSLSLKIGKNKYSSYIRNIPAGTSVKKLIAGLALKKGFQNKYKVAVLNSKGAIQDQQTEVKTGMLLGIYDSSGELAGTADLTVKGDSIKDRKGNDPTWGYASALSITKTSVSGLTAGSGSFTVKAKKLKETQSNGYQLRYSLKSDMSGSKTKIISSSYSKVSKEVTGLKSGKTYYVQVRTIKKVNGYKYYSTWSSARSVTTG